MPMEALKEGVSTSEGTGMTMSTLLAIDRDLNWLLACGWWSLERADNK